MRSYRISLVSWGEMGQAACQELEISLVIYRYERLITLTLHFILKFINVLTREIWQKVVQFYRRQRVMVWW